MAHWTDREDAVAVRPGDDLRIRTRYWPDTIHRFPIGPPSRPTKKSRRAMLSGILAVSEGGLEPPRPLIGH